TRRRNRRRGRSRGRVYHYEEEEEWSDNSTWSWDDQRFDDFKEGTHHYKSEFQPETVVKVSETAAKAATENMRVLSTTENDCAPTPALQSRTSPHNVDQSTTTLVRRVAPPKPPMTRKSQIIQAPVANTQPPKPEPPDSDQSVMIIPRRVPRPKPPDPENYVQGNGSLVKLPPPSESPAADSIAKEFPMNRTKLMKKERRVGWVFYTVGPTPNPMAVLTLMEKIDKGANLEICNIFLNPVGQMHKPLQSILH
ncbi:hypothetical protein A2U01_0031869, partial [Trifolium medium]|nr:hypothetical protein [Trifolium medium]